MYLAGHELVIINGHINKLLHSRTQLDEVSLSKSQTTKLNKGLNIMVRLLSVLVCILTFLCLHESYTDSHLLALREGQSSYRTCSSSVLSTARMRHAHV